MKSTLKTLYSDEFLVVVDKPSGILSIADRYDPAAPVALTMLEETFSALFVVHRIDKDTSGVLAYTRTEEAHRSLSLQFAGREVQKVYLALVWGRPEHDKWECAAPLLADSDRLHRTTVSLKMGKESFTRFEVLERLGDFTYIKAMPETGRTHQVRIHLATTGNPIVADPLYGDGKPVLLSSLKRRWKGDPFEEKPLLSRTALHASRIRFYHPKDGRVMEVEAPLHRDMAATLAQLRKRFTRD